MTSLKKLYDDGVNIMEYFRKNDHSGNDSNTLDAILVSYDLQAGSYIKHLEKQELCSNYHKNGERVSMMPMDYAKEFCKYVASEIDNFSYNNVLEAGVGEATSFSLVISQLENKDAKFCGFDLAPSRVAQGNAFLEKTGVKNAELFAGNLLQTPFADNHFDIVYTIHALEPNTNDAENIIKELYRITRNQLILIEPSFELGNEETRTNIDKHKYIKNLKGIVDKLGYKILKYELAPIGTYSNQPAVMIIEKSGGGGNRKTFKE